MVQEVGVFSGVFLTDYLWHCSLEYEVCNRKRGGICGYHVDNSGTHHTWVSFT